MTGMRSPIRLWPVCVIACTALACVAAAQTPGPAAPAPASGSSLTLPMGVRVEVDPAGSPEDVSQSIKILLLLTVLSLAPSAVIMMTAFMRILIVLSMIRQAIGLQQTPPGQLLAAMALFLTIFVMAPVWQQINSDAVQPYMDKKVSLQDAWDRGIVPLRDFMLRQTGETELSLFIELSRTAPPAKVEDVALHVLVPAFMISELKTAFQMGFLIYLPFLVIDLVIASCLMSLGMMMLPPMMISLPVKLLFFVLADGWVLLIRGLVTSFK
jgi:flagellar biosynthetic protein FliP